MIHIFQENTFPHAHLTIPESGKKRGKLIAFPFRRPEDFTDG
jgi:hypothetical protein